MFLNSKFKVLNFAAINPRAIVSEALRSRDTIGVERDKEVENLAAYIVDVLSVFHYRRSSKVSIKINFIKK